VRPAAPAVAPKTNNFTPLVSFFNQKQQDNKQTNKLGAESDAVAENESDRPIVVGDSGTGLPVRTLKHQPTNYHLKTNETTRPKEMFTTGEN